MRALRLQAITLVLLTVLAVLMPGSARAALVSEWRGGYYAYEGQTDFFSGVLLVPHPLSIGLGPLVSKYIGETEEQLDELFTAVESISVLLFFDEADALFGERTEPDPNDRYGQDFILLDPKTHHWFGQIYYAQFDGIYELDGPFSVPAPASLFLFAGGLTMGAACRRAAAQPRPR
jgi:hypothetical protein